MKPNTLVKFDFDRIPQEYHQEYPFFPQDRFVYLGDIQQAPGHCTVIRVSDGKAFVFYHTFNFIELTEDEV